MQNKHFRLITFTMCSLCRKFSVQEMLQEIDLLYYFPKALPAQLLSLACLGIIFHADVVGVELVARDVGEEFREVQPPQELHRVRVATITYTARGEPVMKREGKG